MSTPLSDSLRVIAHLGAESFSETGLFADTSPTVRRVARRRAARVLGTGAVAAITIGALSLAALGANPDRIGPVVSPSPSSPTPVPSPTLVESGALAGCDGSTEWSGENGNMSEDSLCLLWDGENRLRSDAAVALAGLNVEFRDEFGRDLCVISGYRTIGELYRLRDRSGAPLATPGISAHGWGLAVDFCAIDAQGETFEWIVEHAPAHGWENPEWASDPRTLEPWHWEYGLGTALLDWEPEPDTTNGA